MDSITIDGLDEHEFRRSIENMLRHGEADSAAARLRALLEPYAAEGGILPARFAEITSREITIRGWDRLGERIARYDRPPHRVSALSIAVTDTDPDGNVAGPDDSGRLTPHVETGFYCDEAYPFSEADRNDLLDGYSLYGCEWQGNFEASDSTLAIDGIDDLYGAIARLEARLINSRDPGIDEIRAGSIGACYLSVLVHQAVRDRIRNDGLPRTLCVMAGSNGVYPYFDAPVISSEEYREDFAVTTLDAAPELQHDSNDAETAVMAEGDYESLLTINSRKGMKKPVLVLDAADAASKAREEELAAAAAAQGADLARHGAIDLRQNFEASPHLEQEEPSGPVANDCDAGFPGDSFASTEADDGHVDHPFTEDVPEPAYPPGPPLESGTDHPFEEEAEHGTYRFDPPSEPEAISAPEPAAAAATAQPAPATPGHHLRARIARTEQTRLTFGDMVLAWLQRLADWLARRRR